MKNMDKDALIREIANQGHFTIGDSKVFLDTLISIFGQAIKDGAYIDVRGWGHLYYTDIERDTYYSPTEKVKKRHPKSTRIGFRLAKDLKKIKKKQNEEYELDFGDMFDTKE